MVEVNGEWRESRKEGGSERGDRDYLSYSFILISGTRCPHSIKNYIAFSFVKSEHLLDICKLLNGILSLELLPVT